MKLALIYIFIANSLFYITQIINHPWYKSSNRIALYMSTDQEVDTSSLLAHVIARGAAAFVPQYAGGHMKMLRVLDGDEEKMDITKHGIAQHSNNQLRDDALKSGIIYSLIILAFSSWNHTEKTLVHCSLFMSYY